MLNLLRIVKVKKMILRFEKVDNIKNIIKKCKFSAKKRFGKEFIRLQNEFNSYSFGYVVGNGSGSEYSLRQSMGRIRQLLVG